jgi:hypothetical protein
MSSECPPASAGVAYLYVLAAKKVEILSDGNKICEASASSDVNPFRNVATITAQCQAGIQANWTKARVLSPDEVHMIEITLDAPVEVRSGDTIALMLTLTWG